MTGGREEDSKNEVLVKIREKKDQDKKNDGKSFSTETYKGAREEDDDFLLNFVKKDNPKEDTQEADSDSSPVSIEIDKGVKAEDDDFLKDLNEKGVSLSKEVYPNFKIFHREVAFFVDKFLKWFSTQNFVKFPSFSLDKNEVIKIFLDIISGIKKEEVNEQFRIFYDHLAVKTPMDLATTLIFIYFRYFKDFGLKKKDFVLLINKQGDNSISYGVFKLFYRKFVTDFFKLNLIEYRMKVNSYLVEYVKLLKTLKEFHNIDTNCIKELMNFYDLLVNQENFIIDDKKTFERNKNFTIIDYYFPQTMALSLLYYNIIYGKLFKITISKDDFENLFKALYESYYLRVYYITDSYHNRLFSYIKKIFGRYKKQHYTRESFIDFLKESLRKSFHLETQFILNLYSLTDLDPRIFAERLNLYSFDLNTLIANIVHKETSFYQRSTFINILDFVNQNLKGKNREIALELLSDLQNKRLNQNEDIWSTIYNGIVKKDQVDVNYVLDNLIYIKKTEQNKKQIKKFIDIIYLILDYEQMLNHTEIARKLAPLYDLKVEPLIIVISDISTYLNKKTNFNKKERFPTYASWDQLIPKISVQEKLKEFPALKDHIIKVYKDKGFPDFLIERFKNPNINDKRVSKFSKKITNIHKNILSQKLIKKGFLKELVNNGTLQILEIKDCARSFNLNLLEQLLCKVCNLAKNCHYDEKDIFAGHNSPSHDVVLQNILNNINQCVGIEIPIWCQFGDIYLTGHIDIIMNIDDLILILDYKPDLSPEISLEKVNKSFLSSIPQVASYAFLIKNIFGIKNILCVTFNKNGAWVYHPKILNEDIKQFLIKNNISIDRRPWDTYF